MASSVLKQTDRLLPLSTPLGPDELLLVSLKGREAMSEWFSFDLEAISENDGISASDLIAKPVTAEIETGSEFRYINGIVCEFVLLPRRDHYARYRLRI